MILCIFNVVSCNSDRTPNVAIRVVLWENQMCGTRSVYKYCIYEIFVSSALLRQWFTVISMESPSSKKSHIDGVWHIYSWYDGIGKLCLLLYTDSVPSEWFHGSAGANLSEFNISKTYYPVCNYWWTDTSQKRRNMENTYYRLLTESSISAAINLLTFQV